MMESAVNKLLHAPTTRLRASAGSDDAADMVQTLRHLFDLPEGPSVGKDETETPAPSPALALARRNDS
jgi:hypothetical protein